MALPKLLQKLFQNNGAGDKLNPSIIPTKVNGVAADSSGNITVDANPPSISVSATTLAAGSSATVTKTGTNSSPVFTFGIPQGAKGEKGDKGATGAQGPAGTGFTPVVTAGSANSSTSRVSHSSPNGGYSYSNYVNVPSFTVNAYGQVTKYSLTRLWVSDEACSDCSDMN